MNTITITKKEYNSLVFSKSVPAKRTFEKKKFFWEAGFGVLKNSLGKASSVSIVNKLRKSWRS